MYVKFDIESERLEWYKKRSLFAKWKIQKQFRCISSSTHKVKNEETQLDLILTHSL